MKVPCCELWELKLPVPITRSCAHLPHGAQRAADLYGEKPGTEPTSGLCWQAISCSFESYCAVGEEEEEVKKDV